LGTLIIYTFKKKVLLDGIELHIFQSAIICYFLAGICKQQWSLHSFSWNLYLL